MDERPILVVQTAWDTRPLWVDELTRALDELEVRVWPDVPDPERVVACAVWHPPAELFRACPKIGVVQSLGAGVDHLWKLGDALPDVPVLRLVDPTMTERLAAFALTGVLLFQRRFDVYARQQAERRWLRHLHADPAETVVGILGMGVMGRAVADALRRNGFQVLGWRRSARPVDGVEVHAGRAGLAEVAGRSDMLVCVLPSTAATRGILGAPLFALARPGACLIHAGRGDQLVADDLLTALDEGRLAGALLDVFETEPLPADDPLWRHPKVIVTPHTAAISDHRTGAAAIARDLRIALAGGRPPSLVERARGY